MRASARHPLSVLSLVLCFAASARADMTKQQCVDANGKGQELRRTGKFATARAELRSCTDPSCPGLVRADCTKRLDELEAAVPTIAFEVKDTAGADVTTVKVTIDGQPLADRLTGAAMPVDPGEHTFGFEAAGYAPVTRTLTVTEGVKGRGEVVKLVPLTPAGPAPPGPPPAPPTPGPVPAGPAAESSGVAPLKVVGLTLGGAGVAGLVVGGVFGGLAFSKASAQKSACASAASCSDHGGAVQDRSSGETDSTIATVAFVAGGALLAGGAVLFFVGRKPAEPQASARLLVLPSVGPGGGGMMLRGEF